MPKSKVTSRTDWNRVQREIRQDAPIPHDPGDGPYDPNDDRAVDEYWKQADALDATSRIIRRGRGPAKSPTKQRISIRLSPEVLEHFRSSGKGWQTRMDAALQEWVKQSPRSRGRRRP